MTSVQERMETPPSFVSSLKDALKSRDGVTHEGEDSHEGASVIEHHKAGDQVLDSQQLSDGTLKTDLDDDRPAVLVTNDDGIHAPGLRALVEALVHLDCCHVYVCAPDW